MKPKRPPKSLVPVIDPRTWKPNPQAMDKALGKKSDKKSD